MDYEPAPKALILKEVKLAHTTLGGLILDPIQQKPATLFAEILRVGKEVKNYKVGDLVVSNKGKLISFTTATSFVWLAPDESSIMAKVTLGEEESLTGSLLKDKR